MQNNRERIFAFLETSDLDLEGEAYVGKYELERKSISQYLLSYLQGVEWTNKDTGSKIRASRNGIGKMLHHDMETEAHKKLLVHVPTIIQEMRFVAQENRCKPDGKYDRYQYFLTGVKMDGVCYTVLSTVGIHNGNIYYDQMVFPYEKHMLMEEIKKGEGGFVDLNQSGTLDRNISFSKFRRLFQIWQGEF
jgi:hypothetical protein